MPHERRALLAAIRAAQHAGKIIYVLSGDRHYSEVLKIPESGKDFYEITSSPLSAAPRQGGAAPQFEPRRQLGPFNSNNFAVLTLGEQRVTVAYYSQAGELLGELQL
jgi:hypothetical protein